MTKGEFIAWREWMGWSQEKAAKHLGLSRRTIQAYEREESPIPLSVELACEALTRGVREYRGPSPALTTG